MGTIMLFVGINITNGISASLLTKLIPKEMARSLINAGFLATLAAIIGKMLGNVIMSIVGSAGSEVLHGRLFIGFSVMSGVTLLVNLTMYKRMIHKFHYY